MQKDIDNIIDRIMGDATDFNREDLSDLCCTLIGFSVGVLRGLEGEQFVIDFLTAALNDEEKDKFMILPPCMMN